MGGQQKAKAPIETTEDAKALRQFGREFARALSTLNRDTATARFDAAPKFRRAFAALDERVANRRDDESPPSLGRHTPFGPADAGFLVERACQQTGEVTVSMSRHKRNVCVEVEPAFKASVRAVESGTTPSEVDEFAVAVDDIRSWLPPNDEPNPTWRASRGDQPLMVSLRVTETGCELWTNAMDRTPVWTRPFRWATRAVRRLRA